MLVYSARLFCKNMANRRSNAAGKKGGIKGKEYAKMEMHKNDVNFRAVKRRRKRDEKKLYCQNPLSSHSVLQKGSALVQCTTFSQLHGVPLSLYSLFFSSFYPPSLSPLSCSLSSQKWSDSHLFHIRPTL